MAVVQCTDVKKYKTFGDLAADYYRNLVRCYTFANTVVDIFDRYDIKNSIKSAERERRFKSVCLLESISSNKGQNYSRLEKSFFLFKKTDVHQLFRHLSPANCWKWPCCATWAYAVCCLYFWKPRGCQSVFLEEMVTDYPEFRSIQEEADTRMILQALHVDNKLKEM